jgi:RNA polymerase sigma-70 factor (ECF subfamily)
LGETAEPVDPAPSPHERMESTEARAVLMKALDGLDLDRRAVFVMHELDEIPVPEVASTLAIPLNTAYSRLRLARVDVSAAIQRFRAKKRSCDV